MTPFESNALCREYCAAMSRLTLATAAIAVTHPDIVVKLAVGRVISLDASAAHKLALHLNEFGEQSSPRELARSASDPWSGSWPSPREDAGTMAARLKEVRVAIHGKICVDLGRIDSNLDALTYDVLKCTTAALETGLQELKHLLAPSARGGLCGESVVDWSAQPVELKQGRDAAFNAPEAPPAPNFVPEHPWDQQIAALCHVNVTDLEIPSIELCAKSIWDFPHMPWEFVLDMSRQIWDEARHAVAFLQRLQEMDGRLGTYRAKNDLWDTAAPQDLGLRLTVHQRIGESTGVDGALYFSRKAYEAGDEISATMFEFIARDEIQHVRFGTKWSSWLGNDPDVDPLLTEAQRLRQVRGKNDNGPLTFPLSENVCKLSGVSGKQLELLRARHREFGSRFVDSVRCPP